MRNTVGHFATRAHSSNGKFAPASRRQFGPFWASNQLTCKFRAAMMKNGIAGKLGLCDEGNVHAETCTRNQRRGAARDKTGKGERTANSFNDSFSQSGCSKNKRRPFRHAAAKERRQAAHAHAKQRRNGESRQTPAPNKVHARLRRRRSNSIASNGANEKAISKQKKKKKKNKTPWRALASLGSWRSRRRGAEARPRVGAAARRADAVQ